MERHEVGRLKGWRTARLQGRETDRLECEKQKAARDRIKGWKDSL